jgi:plasmid stability protein
MRQLITRIDDALHARLKERAAAEGRSVNALVTEMIENGVSADDERRRWKARLKAEGRLVVPTPLWPVPASRDEAIETTRGWGTSVSEELEKQRSGR